MLGPRPVLYPKGNTLVQERRTVFVHALVERAGYAHSEESWSLVLNSAKIGSSVAAILLRGRKKASKQAGRTGTKLEGDERE